MNIKDCIRFIDFDAFYSEYKPLTPYGKQDKNRYRIITDMDELSGLYKALETIIQYIKEDGFKADKVENHFRKIALLNSLDRKSFDSSDIFLIKKLLVNFNRVVSFLSDTVKEALDISFHSEDLLELLSPEAAHKESFYLSSTYKKELGEVRSQIAEADKVLNEIRRERFQEIIDKHELDFRFRDFIVVREGLANTLDAELVHIEVYDKRSQLVKPIMPKGYFDCHHQKEALLQKEQDIEQEVLAMISERILAEKVQLNQYLKQVELLDTLFAKARITIKYNMNPPCIAKNTSIQVEEGIYLPLANRCKAMETEYTPLNAKFDDRTIVISGSNMGGKTILLKTIGYLQVMTQMGFYVPAKSFKTTVFKNIHYIGEELSEKVEGLSSFGFEIHNLTQATQGFEEESLLLIDEFAKTTNSFEAKAIISAILKSFSEKEKVYSFLSTHFMELPDMEKLSFYKMKGLNYPAYKKYYDREKQYALEERIQIINSFMQYELVKTNNKDRVFDAIKIADTLGLNEEIITYTKEFLENNYV